MPTDACNKAPRSKLRGILRNSPKPLPSFAKATEGSPRLHPRSKLRGIRRRRINSHNIVLPSWDHRGHLFLLSSSSCRGWCQGLNLLIQIRGSWLSINTGTTIVTFLMVFLIQNSQNRDAKAVHLKLDELIHGVQGARNSLIDLEN